MTTARAHAVHLFGAPLSTVSWFVLFLAAADAFATARLVELAAARELNPAMAWMHGALGTELFAVVKIALTGACLLWMNHRASDKHARVAALVAVAIYLPVVAVNAVTTQAVMG